MFQSKGWAALNRLALFSLCLLALASCATPKEAPLVAGGTSEQAFRTAKLVPPPGSDYARFGHSVATDGETVVVGAWGHEAESGAAYVFEASPEGWQRTALLRPDDAAQGARFGYSLDVEGNTIAVGAIYEASRGHDAGAVYVFERAGGQWQRTAKLLPPGEAEDDHFGRSVSLAGARLAVGAPGAGKVHTFVRAADGWRTEEVIEGDSETLRFGTSLALDDTTLAIGAWTEAPEAKGLVVVLERTADGWSEVQRLRASEGGDRFGYSVGLDGNLLAVGAPDAEDGPMVRLFERVDGVWREKQAALPLAHSPELGYTVALFESSLLVGDPGFAAAADHAGQVVLAGAGAPAALLPGQLPEGSSFGVSLAAAGPLIVVGATGDGSSGQAAGAAYIFY
ncbi:MAG TPA: hypothetical protein VF168_07045 [Trueperaceae bacterium]